MPNEHEGYADVIQSIQLPVEGMRYLRDLSICNSLLRVCNPMPNSRTQNALGSSCSDDDVNAHRCVAHFNAGVAILGQLAGQKLVELCVEHSVSDKLRDKKRTPTTRETMSILQALIS